jgi:hypothetical protein
LRPDGSNIIDTVEGLTWTTSTPNGVRTELTWLDAIQRARRPAHANVDHSRRVAYHFELRGQIGEFERDAKRALDGLLARYGDPQQRRKRDRHELQTEMMTESDVRHQASELRGSSTRLTRPRR